MVSVRIETSGARSATLENVSPALALMWRSRAECRPAPGRITI
jgi:hypothetical protein